MVRNFHSSIEGYLLTHTIYFGEVDRKGFLPFNELHLVPPLEIEGVMGEEKVLRFGLLRGRARDLLEMCLLFPRTQGRC